jgi:hypothetical protein
MNETQQVMRNKKKKTISPPLPITIGPFSPQIAKILIDADKEYQKNRKNENS